MAASFHQAKVILNVYLQRGLAALRKLEAGQLEDGLSLCQWRAAAFHNFRSLDANLRECGVDLALDEEVQKLLQQLERGAGRQRLVHWGPRSLDLDLLWSGKERRSSEQLQLPHPRLWGRRFVIEPLAQLDPDLIPPGQSISVAMRLQQLIALADELPPQQLAPPHNWPC